MQEKTKKKTAAQNMCLTRSFSQFLCRVKVVQLAPGTCTNRNALQSIVQQMD